MHLSLVFLGSTLLMIGSLLGWGLWQLTVEVNDPGIVGVRNDYDLLANRAVFHGKEIIPVEENELVRILAERNVLGESNDENKIIKVDLTQQRLYAYEGDRLIYSFLVSSGKWGRTPTGEFEIWGKFRYTKMEGGSKALRTYYYLPNVPYVMFFANDEVPKSRGFSLHGTYWHNNFGVPMSHGCINMKTEEVALLYQWAQPKLFDKKSILASNDNPGTRVIIYGEYVN